jgi:multisubunit Na+/H+ antiporter MnhB subunit
MTLIYASILIGFIGLSLFIASLIFFSVIHQRYEKEGTLHGLNSMVRKRIPWGKYAFGVIIMIIGAAIWFPFHQIAGEYMYDVTHSLWHIFMGVGFSLILYATSTHRHSRTFTQIELTKSLFRIVTGSGEEKDFKLLYD